MRTGKTILYRKPYPGTGTPKPLYDVNLNHMRIILGANWGRILAKYCKILRRMRQKSPKENIQQKTVNPDIDGIYGCFRVVGDEGLEPPTLCL